MQTQPRESWKTLATLKSLPMLLDFVDAEDVSVRQLAARTRGKRGEPLSPATVGHILSGRRRTCSVVTARAIERALGAPSGHLFDFTESKVADDGRRLAPRPKRYAHGNARRGSTERSTAA